MSRNCFLLYFKKVAASDRLEISEFFDSYFEKHCFSIRCCSLKPKKILMLYFIFERERERERKRASRKGAKREGVTESEADSRL